MICSIKEREKKSFSSIVAKLLDRTVKACKTAVTIVTGARSFINECGEFGDVQCDIAAP